LKFNFRIFTYVGVFAFGLGIGWLHSSPNSYLNRVVPSLHLAPTNQSVGKKYKVKTFRRSYWELTSEGHVKNQSTKPTKSESVYKFDRTIDPSKTAIIVMDAWVDMASQELNKYYGRVIEAKIVPLVEKAILRSHPVFILTNDPAKAKYNTRVHKKLEKLSRTGKAKILYHQDFDDDSFADFLRSKGIDSLVYTGFGSNMCVIGRKMGMIPMVNQNFKMFFVPGASAGVEFGDTWKNNSIHKATTKIIPHWLGEIIQYDDFMM